MTTEIHRTLHLLRGTHPIVEVRAFNGRAKPHVRSFRGVDAAADHVASLDEDDRWSGIYVPLNDGTASDEAPALRDEAVTRRRWLLVDCDAERPADTNASDEELAAAEATADRVAEFLASIEFPVPVRAMSGNGAHLLYPIDLPNNDETKALVKSLLGGLHRRFGGGDAVSVKIDTTVHNASRITKVYGTVARKGAHSDARPQRRSRLVDVPAYLEGGWANPVPRDVLDRALFELDPNSLIAEESGGRSAEEWDEIEKNGAPIGERNETLTSYVGKVLADADELDAETVRQCRDRVHAWNRSNKRGDPLPINEVDRTFDSILSRERRQRGVSTKPPVAKDPSERDQLLAKLSKGLGLEINRVHRTANMTYDLVAVGVVVRLGTAKELRFEAVTDAITEQTGHDFGPRRTRLSKNWPKVKSVILRAGRLDADEVYTVDDAIRDVLLKLLANPQKDPLYVLAWHEDGNKTHAATDIPRERLGEVLRTFEGQRRSVGLHVDGRLHLHLDSVFHEVKRDVDDLTSEKLKLTDVSTALRRAGFTSQRLQAREGGDVQKLRVWTAPPGFIEANGLNHAVYAKREA